MHLPSEVGRPFSPKAGGPESAWGEGSPQVSHHPRDRIRRKVTATLKVWRPYRATLSVRRDRDPGVRRCAGDPGLTQGHPIGIALKLGTHKTKPL